MGLFRRKDERAIPKPGSKEFDAAVQGSAIPDDQSVSMGEPGWTGPEPQAEPATETEPADQEQAEEGGRMEEETDRPRRRDRVMGAILRPPNADGFAGGLSAPRRDPKAEPETDPEDQAG